MSARAMRAAVLAGPRELVLRTVDRPEPAPGRVLVRLEGCGVCGSNLPLWEGREWFRYPIEPGRPGHEGWGRVEACGAGVRALAPGDRVAFLSDGAFAEYDVAAETSCVRLPAELAGRDFPGEPLGCAMNVLARSGVTAGGTVAVVGSGFFGACLVRLAALAGAHVIALSRRRTSLHAALALGAADALALEDDAALVRAVEERTGGALCPVVIEATGSQRALDLAAKLCAVRARLVIAGYHQDGPRQVDLQLWNWRGLDVINAHERDPARYVDGMRAAVEATLRDVLDPAALVTHRFPLERAAEAFDALERRPEGFLKAVVTMEGEP